ncbi:LysR family transcriptional regulator [Brenneria goodwinii]|uniref:LysR family transcriptional regulator n=1 Tax=Brenneria goodwinii TaxID=1109412 RepID=A0AAE8EM03_9GAMM|nr:LysR family transcriptional regulator [Brenneria goodwinii]ATA26974.1 LysR family transcriptional regulator [Brenneria goodwinii]RLM20230.1 LysR family transcriptional regulator [Brenneria goodwinii]
MTPKQLEVFISVVQLGSVTAAAAQLTMSQPSVSKSLALIEQQMGFSLFERHKGKMQPTPEARELYKEALRVHQDRLRFDRFVDHIRQYRVGQLRICATPALALNILPLAVARFRQTFPDYGVVADMCLNNEIEAAVEGGRYDLGFMVKPGHETEDNRLAVSRGEMVCVLPERHALAQQAEVCWQDISPRELVFITTDARLVAMIARQVPEFRQRQVAAIETNRYSMAINLVRHGSNSVTIVDRFSLQGIDTAGLAVRPFRPALQISVVAVTDGHSVMSQPGEVFVNLMTELMAETAEI